MNISDCKLKDLVSTNTATSAHLDTEEGEEVTIRGNTVVEIRCLNLPGVVQVAIQEGQYATRTAFMNCYAQVNP